MKLSDRFGQALLAIKTRVPGIRRAPAPRVHISCVVDDRPIFRMQAWNWLLSLNALSTECGVFIHHLPGTLTAEMQGRFRDLGATLVPVTPFGTGEAKYCNKLRQLETEAFLDADFVVMSDADLVFLEDPARLVRRGKIRAKTVDAPNPPEELWSQVFKEAGLRDRVTLRALDMFPQLHTFSTNFNGGLYVMPSAMARALHPLWVKHTRQSLEQTELLGEFLCHADQIGLGLALAESGAPVAELPFGANMPTNFTAEELGRVPEQPVSAIHYHGNMDPHGLPKLVGVDWMDAAIARARKALDRERRKGFRNEIFWDFRYATNPELGSGLGSREASLADKRDMLRPYFEMMGKAQVLDVGCGDLEVLAPMPIDDYTGIDVSVEALSVARAKRPDWQFKQCSVADIPDKSFDYVLCIDVLIHQPDEDAVRALARDLVRMARKGVLFSCHALPVDGTGISFDSQNILEYLESMPEVTHIFPIGSYRDVTLYLAEIGLGARGSIHDIGLHEMAIGARSAPDADQLRKMIAYSREKIGFFPKTVIRCHEYPWFAERMQDCEGKRILDVGAGVCCLPFLLAERGADVTTVDRHETVRNDEDRSEWNEWGFLDYGALYPGIRSLNMDMKTFGTDEAFDIIYSISVIEHMTAEVRRSVIDQMARLSRPGGTLLLSLDLFPGSTDLWNYNEGQIVDETGHGTLGDIKAELSAAGFHVASETFIRAMPLSRTDVAYLVCDRCETPHPG